MYQLTDYCFCSFQGSESEPFIVRHPEGGSTDHFLVTVAERYVLEKDIEGNVTEALDQRCLKRVDLITGDKVAGIKQRASDELILVRLYFDYYKKARAERCYIMEDRQTAEVSLLSDSSSSSSSSFSKF